jgi:hypothetical protein
VIRAAALALVLALGALCASAAAQTPPLLCLGTEPRFLLAARPGADGAARATFDYLGDGTFDFAPMPEPGLTFSRHTLSTAGGPIDVFLEARGCPALGMELPVTIQMGIPAAGGIVTFTGCCLWQDG